MKRALNRADLAFWQSRVPRKGNDHLTTPWTKIVKEIKVLSVSYETSAVLQGHLWKALKIVKIYYSESMLNGSRSITEPQVGHLAAMCGEILRTRGEEGLDDASDKLLQSSNGSITFIFVGRLGTIPLDLKNVTICCEMFANTSRAWKTKFRYDIKSKQRFF